MENQHMNLNNGDNQQNWLNLFMLQCILGAMNEFWLVHPECTAAWSFLFIVTIVEIHMLILDECLRLTHTDVQNVLGAKCF